MAWRYLAIKLNGDGTQELLHPELPLSDVRITDDLSGPGGITAQVKPEVASLRTPGGRPIFLEWSTLVVAVKDGKIRGGGILERMTENGSSLKLECVGPAGYPYGMPYSGDRSWIGVDPMEIVRHIWSHLQGEPGGNLGVIVVTNASPVRIGTPERDVNFSTEAGESVAFTAGPYVLGWWKTHNLGRELDDLAKTTPFQYRTTWKWVGDSAVATVEYSFPSLGTRQHDLRFMLGENVFERPVVTYEGDEFATDVIVLGAGSGREIRNGQDSLSGKRPRLRRVIVLEDKTISTNERAKQVAQAELKLRQLGEPEITDLVVVPHPNAPLGSYAVGDEILVSTRGNWSGNLDVWCKVITLEYNPLTGVVDIQVVRTEKIG